MRNLVAERFEEEEGRKVAGARELGGGEERGEGEDGEEGGSEWRREGGKGSRTRNKEGDGRVRIKGLGGRSAEDRGSMYAIGPQGIH